MHDCCIMPNLFTARFNTSYIKKSNIRANREQGAMTEATATVTWIRNILITLFFTPVVAVTSLFAKNSIISLANIFLALFSLFEFIYRAFLGNNLLDTFLTILGIMAAIFFAVTFATNFLPVAITFTSILDCLNIVATAINSYFALKDVLNPLIIKIIRHILNLFGKGDLVKTYTYVEITEITDPLGYRTFSRNGKDIKYANRLLRIYEYYINRYSEVFLGNIVRKSDIYKLRDGSIELAQDGIINSATAAFITKKINSKLSKIQVLLEIKDRIDAAFFKKPDSSTNLEYQQTVKPYFYDYFPLRRATISYQFVSDELNKHILIQFRKFLILRSSIPPKDINDKNGGLVRVNSHFTDKFKRIYPSRAMVEMIDEYNATLQTAIPERLLPNEIVFPPIQLATISEPPASRPVVTILHSRHSKSMPAGGVKGDADPDSSSIRRSSIAG